MKTFYLLAIFALAATLLAFPVEEGRENGENGWYVPQINGSFIWMTIEEAQSLLEQLEQQEKADETTSLLVPVSYYLYTSQNPNSAQKISATATSISNSNFDFSNPTRIVIHGWLQSYTSSMNTEIRDAWLSRGDYNIIVIDWARARFNGYVSSVAAVKPTGIEVANFINYLVENHSLSLDTTEVIGHSLGAQIAGYIAKNIDTGKLHAIVGLDPALPLFSYDDPNTRLNSEDANYVQSIQTDGGQYGFLKPIGKGAFYPNGGEKQPGCDLDLTGSCDHARSCIYYAEAVTLNNFPSMRCEDYEEAVARECGDSYSGVKMGAVTDEYMVSGYFYVHVHSTAPYGYGY